MRIILITLLSLACLSMFGQEDRQRRHDAKHGNHSHRMSNEQVESLKIAFLTKALELSPTEAQGFWPIYNEYSEKKRAIKSARKERHTIQDLTDDQANDMIEKLLEDKQEELELDKYYVAKFMEVLSPQKVINIFALERKFKEEMLKDVRRRLNEKN